MTETGVTQKALAAACGKDQGHLSKVLSGKLPLAAKTEQSLRAWLERSGPEASDDKDDVATMVDRIAEGSAERRMQIMHLLEIVENLSQRR